MQIKVTIKNTFSYVSKDLIDLPDSLKEKLVKGLSYSHKINLVNSEEVYLFTRSPYPKEDEDRYYWFPTGLLPKFYSISKANNIPIVLNDQRGPKPPLRPVEEFFDRVKKVDPTIEKRDYQEEAIKKGLKYGRGLIDISTGGGKTIVIAGLTYCINAKTLILCVGKEHIHQMQSNLESLLDVDVRIYHKGRGGESGKIVIANVQALNSLKKKNENKFRDFMARFKCIIGDEAHHISAISYKQVFYFAINAYFKYGFSGTMHREDGTFLEVVGTTGPVIDKRDYTFLQENNYISPAKFYFIDPMCRILYGKNNYWPYCLSPGIVHNQMRNEWIGKICLIYQKRKKQVLIITPLRTEHGMILQEIIPGSRFMYGGSDDYAREQALKDFKEKKFNVLIGSKIYDEVINLPDVRCIIMAGGGKAYNSFFQRVGRGIRKFEGKTHVDIIIPWDSHCKILLRHSKKMKSYIRTVEAWRSQVKMVGDFRPEYEG